MSGNNKNEWDKFLNGGLPNYNFSYRQEKIKTLPAGTNVTLAPIPAAASTAIPATKPNINMNIHKRNNQTQKVELPALKGPPVTAGKNRGLKGGKRRRQQKTCRGRGRK